MQAAKRKDNLPSYLDKATLITYNCINHESSLHDFINDLLLSDLPTIFSYTCRDFIGTL